MTDRAKHIHHAGAAAGANQIVQLDQRNWRTRLRQGLRAWRRGDHQAASSAFHAALALAPNQTEVLTALGRHHLREGRYEEARSLLERAFTHNPRSVLAAALLARTLGLHLDRLAEAFALLQRSLSHTPHAGLLHVVHGELWLAQGDPRAAGAAFSQALQLDATDEAAQDGLARAFNMHGIALSQQGAYERAVFAFKRAADATTGWSAPAVNLGVAFARLGQHQRAIRAYRQALQHDPHNPVAYFNLALAYRQIDDLENAADIAERLLLTCPDYPQARSMAASIMLDRSDYDRAIALLLDEVERSAPAVDAWSSLGLAYIGSGNIERGEACLHHAVDLDPKHLSSYYNLALLYATQQRHDAAERILHRAYALDPARTLAAVQSRPALAHLQLHDTSH